MMSKASAAVLGILAAAVLTGCQAIGPDAASGGGDGGTLFAMKARAKKMTPGDSAAGVADKQAKAIESANQWLFVCDQGKYGESWEAASSFFRNAVKKDQWEQTASAVRSPLGSSERRQLKSASYRTTCPGMPDGEYFILELGTVFVNKKEATETVTMMLDDARGWRVAGYYIK